MNTWDYCKCGAEVKTVFICGSPCQWYRQCPKSKWWNRKRHVPIVLIPYVIEKPHAGCHAGKYIFSGDGRQVHCKICEATGRMDTPEGDNIISGDCHKDDKL